MAVSEYPAWVRRLVAMLMLVVFVAAAMPSLFRLYSAGYHAHLESINSQWQAAIVGVSTFLLAEFIIITSTLAASILYKRGRFLFAFPIIGGLVLAFVGNWTVVRPNTVFEWLETILPPLAVLVMSLVGERLILDAVKRQHADEKNFTEALQNWQQQNATWDTHPKWNAVYGRALIAALKDANGKGKGAKERIEFIKRVSRPQWAALVRRELVIERGEWLNDASNLKIISTPLNPTQETENRPFGPTPTDPDAPASGPIMRSVNGHTEHANVTKKG